MASQTGHRVLFKTASDWVVTLTKAHKAGRLDEELKRAQRYGLIIIDLCRCLHNATNWVLSLSSLKYLAPNDTINIARRNARRLKCRSD
jgi:hypothetical protein